jgi:hypothetical protein
MSKSLVIILILCFILPISYMLFIDSSCRISYSQERTENDVPQSSNGNSDKESWIITWGNDNSNNYGNSLTIDTADNIYIAGKTGSDLALWKYNSSGELIWNQTWGGADIDLGNGIDMDTSGNIYIAGRTFSYGEGSADVCLLKFDNLGDLQWVKTWGGTDFDAGLDVLVDLEGNLYVTGYTFGTGGVGMILIKYNNSGNQLWNKTCGEMGTGNGLGIDSLNNIYVVGQIVYTENYDYDMALIKFNSTGTIQWNLTWGDENLQYGNAIVIDSLDNVYIAGGFAQPCVVKYSTDGTKLWDNVLNKGEWTGIALDSLENVYVAGSGPFYPSGLYDFYLAYYNFTGERNWDLIWGKSREDFCEDVALDSEDNVYLVGSTLSYGTDGWKLILVKNPVDIRGNNTFIGGYYPILLINFLILGFIITFISWIKKIKKIK